jgi:hypothetical protein
MHADQGKALLLKMALAVAVLSFLGLAHRGAGEDGDLLGDVLPASANDKTVVSFASSASLDETVTFTATTHCPAGLLRRRRRGGDVFVVGAKTVTCSATSSPCGTSRSPRPPLPGRAPEVGRRLAHADHRMLPVAGTRAWAAATSRSHHSRASMSNRQRRGFGPSAAPVGPSCRGTR